MNNPEQIPEQYDKTENQPSNEPSAVDLDDASLYLNRELTWLSFNRRVLAEASREKNPLLERVKFLAIVSN
ncbi:MAG: hypothetical protein ABW119_21445, partial [Candidatus Thiodiazotropha lotti]